MMWTGQATKPRASEGGHWYDRDGTPRYEVQAKDGSMRPATLRDARKFGWYPGVTSIIRCAAAPTLEEWKRDQAILAALTLPRSGQESHDELMAKIRTDADAQARKARDDGTAIHAAIQGHYEGTPPSEDLWAFVKGVTERIEANFPGRKWLSEHPVAHPIGYGTKADLHARDAVLDFKGSDFDEEGTGNWKAFASLKTYDEHDMQLAATRRALAEKGLVAPDAPCAIVYVSRVVPGLAKVCHIDEPDLRRGLEMFDALHAYWCSKQKYYPALWSEKEAA